MGKYSLKNSMEEQIMKRSLIFFLIFVVLLAACAQQPAVQEPAAQPDTGQSSEAQPAASEGEGEPFYVFLPKGLDNPYWDACRKGMDAKAAEMGVKAEFLGPAVSDAVKQVEIFESVISRKPAAIAVSPNDPKTVEESIARAMDAGIPVITWDADAPDSQRILYIGTDNVAAGRTAGETLAELIGGKGKVAILHGALTALNAQQRVQGFEEALANYPDIEIVATEPTEDSPETALSKAEALLQAHPDLAAFYGVTGVGVPGAAGAVKQANKCGDVKVVGFDVVPQGIEFMRAGCVDALISQRPYGMTAEALEILVDLSQGKTMDTTNIDTGVEVVYPDGLEEFLQTDH
jgi:ABC-type sugar transport system substrate-binding protein